jgi:hypothetical protein
MVSVNKAGRKVEGFDARRARFVSGADSGSLSSPSLSSLAEAKISCRSAWSLKLVRRDEPPTLDLVAIGLTGVTILGRVDSVIVRRRFILDARGVVALSESKVESVCSTELQLLLGKSVVRGCPFEHKLQCQRCTVRKNVKKYQCRLLSPTILISLKLVGQFAVDSHQSSP